MRSGAFSVLIIVLAGASRPSSAQQAIPIRHVTVIAATDSGVIKGVDAIHVMSDGHVLLDDVDGRRLLLFDSTLKRFTISADTAPGAPVNFGIGPRAGMGN